MQIFERKKIAFFIDDLNYSQLNFGIFNQITKNYNYDINIFCRNLNNQSINLNTGIFNISDLFGYTGPVISTSLTTTQVLLNCPSPFKYFYIWDLEWIRIKQKNFKVLSEIYNNSSIKYITRNNDYKDIIEKCWNNKISYTIDNFSFLDNKEFINDIEKQRIPLHSRRNKIS